jgi:DNA-binding beta-propeller fold protein YncE
MRRLLLLLVLLSFALPMEAQKTILPISTGKQLLEPVPGNVDVLNGMPTNAAWSPDHRYLAFLNAGYGTPESRLQQSIAVWDTETEKQTDFPEMRTAGPQTFFAGLAFSADGKHIYASLSSITNPTADGNKATGNSVAVYSLSEGKLTAERLIPVPMQKLAKGKQQNAISNATRSGMAIPAPTGIAVVKASGGKERLLVADEYSDDALLLDAESGAVIHRFDLSVHATVPAEYPIAAAATPDGRYGLVTLWNGSAVVLLDLVRGVVLSKVALLPPHQTIRPSSHPIAITLSANGRTVFVALANRDAVAKLVLAGNALHLAGYYDVRLPGQSTFGAMPDGVTLSPGGQRLYVANSGSNAVAVINTAVVPKIAAPWPHVMGFIPTEWYTSAIAADDKQIYVATGKGRGTGPNKAAPAAVEGIPTSHQAHAYIAALIHGSLARIDRKETEQHMAELTREADEANLMHHATEQIVFRSGTNPIRHVIYVIKENRTYDQVFGDLPEANGDKSLVMYGRDITPNQHKLAEQFGILDNFYDSGEISGNGHVWSTAGITSDYTERTWPVDYRGRERGYDFEGVVAGAYPIQQGIPDVNEPQSGYLWTNLAKHGKSLMHFGEFVSTKFCDDSGEAPKNQSPLEGTPQATGVGCKRTYIRFGEEIPANYGGGKSQWPWRIPLILNNTATKPELVGNFDPDYPDFNLSFPDNLRLEEFFTKFRVWEQERKAGKDAMPSFVMLRLPDDHTAGTRPGMPRPRASIADNDLAVGRLVEAVSHSRFWQDTAIFVLEDDAQDGADHVDAHRSIALVISKYAPRAKSPVVESNFYTTVSVIRTMESLLGLPPMNNNDAMAPLMSELFAGAGDQPPFDADRTNLNNNMIYEVNTERSAGARQSSQMDFTHADRADSRVLNVVLWQDAKGNQPVPSLLRNAKASVRKDDDD